MDFAKAVFFIFLVHQNREIASLPLEVNGADVYRQQEIKNLRARSWNISHGQPDYAVGKRSLKISENVVKVYFSLMVFFFNYA